MTPRSSDPFVVRLAGLTALAACLLVSCSATPQSGDRSIVEGPPAGIFNNGPTGGVDAVFERRCASLDCHGQVGRPLRLYSSNGLRLANDAGLVPGGGPSTTDEQNANYRAIISIEPEKMTSVVKATPNGDPFTLLILQKPLNLQAHKGGTVISKQDSTATCLSTWIGQGQLDPGCMTAALPP